MYNNDCKAWQRRPAVEKTWVNFKLDFMAAYHERRELNRLQQQGSISQHFGANTTPTVSTYAPSSAHTPSSFDDASSVPNDFFIANENSESTISALANATLETGSHVANLARDNANLRNQVRDLTTTVECMEQLIIGANRTPTPPPPPRETNPGRGRGRDGNRGGRGFGRCRDPGYEPNSTHYCWSHGLTRTSLHTSRNYRTPEPGHKREATYSINIIVVTRYMN